MQQAQTESASQDGASRFYLLLIVFVASVGGFIFGFDTLIVSGAILFLRKHFDLNASQVGFVVSFVLIGCAAGTIVAGWMTDRIGRKRTMMVAAVVFAISAIGSALSRNVFELNAYRFLGGIGMGVAMMVSPMYIAEVSPARIRGRLVTVNQIAMDSGAFAALLVSYFFARCAEAGMLTENAAWRWMFACECVPILLLTIGLHFVPRSPRWLVGKNRHQEAITVLTKIEGPQQARTVVTEIADSIAEETGTWSELLRPGIRMALAVGIGVAIIQQFTGGYALTVYAPTIYMKGGFSDPAQAIGMAVQLNICLVLFVLIACWLVERLGRKPLMIFGVLAMGIGEVILSACFHWGWWGYPVPVVLVLTIGCQEMSTAALGWVVLSEIFPTRVRAKALAITTCILWVASYTTGQFFPPLMEYFETVSGTPAGAFLVFAAFCALGAIFFWLFLPETKGKTLEEIARFWLHPASKPGTANKPDLSIDPSK